MIEAATKVREPLLWDSPQLPLALYAIERVCDHLAEQYSHSPMPQGSENFSSAALAGGSAGHALCLWYASRALTRSDYQLAAESALRHALATLELLPAIPSLFDGLCGVLWVSAHLQNSISSANIDHEMIDKALMESLTDDRWSRSHDLVHGAVGAGVYGLERMRGGGTSDLVTAAVLCLERLAAYGEPDRPWTTPPELLPDNQRRDFPTGVWDLGMAHGLAGVVAFLARAVNSGVAQPLSDRLLRKATSALTSTSQGSNSGQWLYPARIRGRFIVPSRLAWCYGDLGVALALHAAGKATGNLEWVAYATAAITHAAKRTPDSSGVLEANLCHGSAGVAHGLARLAECTGSSDARLGAIRWLEHLMECCSYTTDRGITFFEPSSPTREECRGGFIEGAAGIALALQAACFREPPVWDRVLLIG